MLVRFTTVYFINVLYNEEHFEKPKEYTERWYESNETQKQLKFNQKSQSYREPQRIHKRA